MENRPWLCLNRVNGVRLALLAVIAATIGVAWIHSSMVYEEYLPNTALLQVIGDIAAWQWLLLIPLLTCFNLGARYLKWVFLLRTFGLLAPSRDLLKTYLVSFSGNVVPFYAAYLVRLVPLTQGLGRGVLVLAVDLLLDALAILVVGLSISLVGLGIIVAMGFVLLAMLLLGPDHGNAKFGRKIFCAGRIVVAAVYAIVVWWMTGLALGCALKAFGADVDWLRTIHQFALSQQAGKGVTTLAGVLVGGRELIELLLKEGFPVVVAVGATIALRLWTFWLTIGVALIVLLVWRRIGTGGLAGEARFDMVASRYKDDMPEHMRRRYLQKKIALNLKYLPFPRFTKGLDAGCGQGWYLNAMNEAGYKMTGVDYSLEQLKQAETSFRPFSPKRLVRGSIMELPFADQSFDFVYSINTLHHLASVTQQQAAFDEMNRVLINGGRVIVHEMNIQNPFFRLYLGYVFPLIKAIDEGTEIWLKKNEQSLMQGFRVLAKEYQTLLPDFTPPFLLPWLNPLERMVEKSRLLRQWTAHVAYILEKEAPRHADR